jgi:hypothetical protein
MNMAYRGEGGAQLADGDCGQAGVADVTATRVTSPRTTTALSAE